MLNIVKSILACFILVTVVILIIVFTPLLVAGYLIIKNNICTGIF